LIAKPVRSNPSLLHTPIKQSEGTLKKVFSVDSDFRTKRFSMIEILEVRLLLWKRQFKCKMNFMSGMRFTKQS